MQNLHPAELARWLAPDAGSPAPGAPLLLDVREHWEYALCSLPGSVHVPMREIPARLNEFDPSRPIVCICHPPAATRVGAHQTDYVLRVQMHYVLCRRKVPGEIVTVLVTLCKGFRWVCGALVAMGRYIKNRPIFDGFVTPSQALICQPPSRRPPQVDDVALLLPGDELRPRLHQRPALL